MGYTILLTIGIKFYFVYSARRKYGEYGNSNICAHSKQNKWSKTQISRYKICFAFYNNKMSSIDK